MEFALIALRQTAVMFLLMGIGWALYRGGKVSRDGSKDLANLLLYVILPCAILHAFCTEYTAEKSRRLFYAFWLSLAALLLALTNWVKPTKKLHPIVFIALSAVVGVAFGFAGA